MAHDFYNADDSDNDLTIGFERQRLDEQKYDGTVCACCGLRVKFYDRRFRAVWLIALQHLWDAHQFRPWKKSEVKLKAGDWRFLRNFSLIEFVINPDTGRQRRGLWQLTLVAARFLQERDTALIPPMVTIFNKRVVGGAPELISFATAQTMTGEFEEDEPFRPATRPSPVPATPQPAAMPSFGLPIDVTVSVTDNPFAL